MDAKELIALIGKVDDAASNLTIAVNSSSRGHKTLAKRLLTAKVDLFQAVMGRKPNREEVSHLEND